MTHSKDKDKVLDHEDLWAAYREAEANLRAARERERDARAELNGAETRRMNAATAERRAWTELCKALGKPDEDALDTERKVRVRAERQAAEVARERDERVRKLEEEIKRRESDRLDKAVRENEARREEVSGVASVEGDPS